MRSFAACLALCCGLLWGCVASGGGTSCSFEAASDTLHCSLSTFRSTADGESASQFRASASRARHLSVSCERNQTGEDTYVARGHFGSLPQLRSLRVQQCHIRKVATAALSELSGLRSLEVCHVRLARLEAEAFAGLRQLRSLNLSHNEMWGLPGNVFCQLRLLQTLNLSSNYLQDLAELGFSSSEVAACKLALTRLDLSHNAFSRVPARVFGQLRKLRELDLSHNSLSIIEDDALGGLTSLETASLASNELVALPPSLFSTSPSLKEVNLQNNSLTNIAPALFQGLEHLVVLNLSRNELSNEWLNDPATFRSLVRLVALDLSHNQLAHLDAQLLRPLTSLQLLDLSYNRLLEVSPNAFLSQYNLHILHLSHNQISHLRASALNGLSVLSSLSLGHNVLDRLESDVFVNCSSIVDLGVNDNQFDSVPSAALRSLPNLRTLDLGDNQISRLTRESLRGLDGLYALRMAGNGITNLTSALFEPVSNLKVLNLAHNRLSTLEQTVFSHLKKLRLLRLDNNELSEFNGLLGGLTRLKWLNVSANELQWFDYAFLPKSLEVLDISANEIEDLGNYYKLDEGFKLRSLTASHNRIKKLDEASLLSSLENILLPFNRIKSISAGVFQGKPSLQSVDLRRNQMRKLQLQDLAIEPEGTALPDFYLSGNPFLCNCEMEWLQKINEPRPESRGGQGQRQYPHVADLDDVECRVHNWHPNSVSSNRDMRKLMEIPPEQFVCGYQAHCFALCKCCDFFACDCRMQCPEGCACYHDSTWSANIIQCSVKQHIDIPPLIPMDATAIYLDGNNLTGTLESQAFIGRKRVQYLYLNHSQIEAINNQTFNGLTELQVLHLEDNLIRRLEGYEFGNLTSLRQLFLHNNRLTFIDPLTFASLVSIEELYLHDNRLAIYPAWELRRLTTLTIVTLAGNPWSCGCDFIHKFQNFTSSEVVNVVDLDSCQCHSPSLNGPLSLNKNVTCTDDALAVVLGDGALLGRGQVVPVAAALAGVAGILVLVCALVLLFVFRTPLRVWLHSKYGLRVFDPCGRAGRDKLYDAFVSYSLKDEDFVRQILVPQLEQAEPSYKLCLQHRDLPSSSSISDTFPGVSQLCAKHVLVVSRAYLECEWGQIQLALQEVSQRLKPIIVLLEELATLELAAAPDFHLLLKAGPVVRWSEAGFWNKLRFYLPDAKMRAYKKNLNSATTTFASQGSPSVKTSQQQQSQQQQQHHHWHYDDGLQLHSNQSSTSTRSTATTHTGEDKTEAGYRGGNGSPGMGLVTNPLAEEEHIYHTLEPPPPPAPGAPAPSMLEQFHTVGKLDVMLPNGQFVPATLVRHKNGGAVMPLVEIGGGGSPAHSDPGVRAASSKRKAAAGAKRYV